MKIRLKNRKKTFLVISIVVIIIFIVILLLPLCISFSKFKIAKFELRNYFLNDFETSTIKSTEKSEFFSSYERSSIKQGIKYLEGENKLDSIKYLNITENIKELFKNECTEENFEYCDPYKILMPYCMSSRNSWIIDGRDLGIFKKEISKDILYNRAIEYWRTYIEEKELKEDELSTFDSVVLAEKLCGNLSQDDVENLLRKLLKIEIDQNQPIERTIYSLKKKVSVIKSLQDPDCFSRFSEFESLKHSICNKMPSIDEIEKLNDVCVTYNYYVVKNFCSRDAVVNSIRDYLLITKYLEERYSDSEEILCQMAIYQLSEK